MNNYLNAELVDTLRSRGSKFELRCPFQIEEVVYARESNGGIGLHSRRTLTKWLGNNEAQNTLAETIAYLRHKKAVRAVFPALHAKNGSENAVVLDPQFPDFVEMASLIVMKSRDRKSGLASQFDAWLRPRDVKTGTIKHSDAYPPEFIIAVPPGALHDAMSVVHLREALIVEWQGEFEIGKARLELRRQEVSRGLAL